MYEGRHPCHYNLPVLNKCMYVAQSASERYRLTTRLQACSFNFVTWIESTGVYGTILSIVFLHLLNYAVIWKNSKRDSLSFVKEITEITVIKEIKLLKLNSVAWVREWTISNEWPPFVGEVCANFVDRWVSRSQRRGYPTTVISVF
jgi:hypothetical protein